MTERVARLALRIAAGPEADAAELAELAVDLREQLLELEIDGDVLEVTGITWKDQRELIQIWIDRHTDRLT